MWGLCGPRKTLTGAAIVILDNINININIIDL